MSEALFSHVYPGTVEGGVLICKTCGEKIPNGKLACPACLMGKSQVAYAEHQAHYIHQIVTDQTDMHFVYIPGGEADRTPLWHIRRITDITHGFCGKELGENRRQDYFKYSELYTRDKLCPACKFELDQLIRKTESHDYVSTDSTDGPALRS
jgi:hypothetical protein